MFLSTTKITVQYTRKSHLGVEHSYSRTKTIAVFECNCCGSIFERALGKIDHRRVSNDYQHVCPNCNPKQFAQARGVENRRLWNISVDSDLKISKL
jgi:rubredoxin